MDHLCLCYLCLVFVMLSRLFTEPGGKGGGGVNYFPIWYLRTGVVLDCIDS